MQKVHYGAVAVSLIFLGCTQTSVVDYAVPRSVIEERGEKEGQIQAIYDIERVLSTRALDLSPEKQVQHMLNPKLAELASDLGIGSRAGSILMRELLEGLGNTLQLVSEDKVYTAHYITFCGNYSSRNAIEAFISDFSCEDEEDPSVTQESKKEMEYFISSQMRVQLDDPTLPLFIDTIPLKPDTTLTIVQSPSHPYVNIQWYTLNGSGITSLETGMNKIHLQNIESRSAIFAVAKAEHDSLTKQFVWILVPAQEIESATSQVRE